MSGKDRMGEDDMDDAEFLVEGMRVQANLDNDMVRLVFEDMKGGERAVVIARQRLPQIAAALQPGNGSPPQSASAPDLRSRQMFDSKGYEVRKRPDGGLTLIHHIETQPGRGVSVPLNLSRDEVADLIKHISK